ncbi:MAG: enoyl-CoA hydratase/isomerase family protein [Candidatus Lambdaproteobacteria bacterium]|nr:enoyl-CoA hydratase/isomerase family protein [Candidatus Lambdaproteobacteria bacterium]
MDADIVKIEIDAHVGMLTLNRPARLNALSDAMREGILSALQGFDADPEVRAVLVTGAGRAFCAGGDVKQMRERLDAPAGPLLDRPRRRIPANVHVIQLMRRMGVPIIAAINGPAVAAGMNLALACDLRIASDQAIFGEAFVKRGAPPAWGGTYFLPRLVGPAKASELIFSGDVFDAAEALRLGIVNRVVPHERFWEEALGWARQLAAGPTMAIGLAKRNIYTNLDVGLAAALDNETYAIEAARHSEDNAEGIRSFVEKREPSFKGR